MCAETRRGEGTLGLIGLELVTAWRDNHLSILEHLVRLARTAWRDRVGSVGQ